MRAPEPMRTFFLALAATSLLATACARRAPEVVIPAPGPAEAARHRAALATLRVDNRSVERLTIIYRPVADAGGPVAVGTVEPRSVMVMAPLPAGEPLVLTARIEDGRSFSLPARTLEVDQEWTWIVPAATVFR
jgi:hypothetical protein